MWEKGSFNKGGEESTLYDGRDPFDPSWPRTLQPTANDPTAYGVHNISTFTLSPTLSPDSH
jgi:hypothetical protein